MKKDNQTEKTTDTKGLNYRQVTGISGCYDTICPDISLLASFLDHSLSDTEHEAVEAHLAHCLSCTEALLDVRKAISQPDEELSDNDLHAIFELVPPSPGILERIITAAANLMDSSVSLPVAAVCLLMICCTGFYAGMKTELKNSFINQLVSDELTFSIHLPDTEILNPQEVPLEN